MFDDYERFPRYSETEARIIPSYELRDDNILEIYDPVWGKCDIGHEPEDAVLLQLLHTPLVRRSMAIEQLTLDATTSTVPGTANFSRWEHIWGSVVFVRKVTENIQLEPRERILLQLRTFVSDLAHTAYSHLGDWMFQGSGGAENQHDMELLHLLEVGGVTEVLRSNGIAPEEVVFPDIEDWVECPSPDLCVDRVDYGAREIKRWLDLIPGAYETMSPQAFTVVDQKLIMKNKQLALQFAKAFLLLPTEHWSEPVHRLQLQLQEEVVRDVIVSEYAHLLAITPMDYDSYHPRDLLFTTDGDLTREMALTWGLGRLLRPLMNDIGAAKRRIFIEERAEQLAMFLGNDGSELPHPLKHFAWFKHRDGKIPLIPSFVSIIPIESVADVPDFEANPYTIDFLLPALKPRHIDPLYFDEDGQIKRLHETDDNFAKLCEQQRTILQQAYVGRLHVNSETKKAITEKLAENRMFWKAALTRKRMPDAVMRSMLHNTVAVAAVNRMIDIRLY